MDLNLWCWGIHFKNLLVWTSARQGWTEVPVGPFLASWTLSLTLFRIWGINTVDEIASFGVQFQWSNWIDFTLYVIYIMYYIYYVLYMICDILYYMFYIIYNHSFTFSPQRYHGGFIGFNPQDVSPVSRPGIRSSPSLPSQVSWSSGAPRDQKRALKRKRWVTKTGCTMDISWLYRYTTGNGHITMDISHYQYMMEI